MEAKKLRVLVAIDGSAAAQLAVDLVADVAWPAGTEIVVAEAVETGAGVFAGAWPAPVGFQVDRVEAQVRAEAEQTLDEARRSLDGPTLRVKAAVLCGRPATAIVDQARAMRADLIVVGSRGHGTIASMVLGSVSAEVVDHAPAPVLVARGRGIDRVVLAWDGSAGASRAADLVSSWPIFGGASIRVVSVAAVEVPWWTGFPAPGTAEFSSMYVEVAAATRGAQARLADEKAHELQALGLKVEADRREGDAATQIIAAATAAHADIIVMGTHGRTGLSRLIIGSVARNVLHHAACSVLIVREGLSETSLPGGLD